MKEKIDENLYQYCSEQIDMMLEDLEKYGKIKDEPREKPCPKFVSWQECYYTCIYSPGCREYYRVMEEIK